MTSTSGNKGLCSGPRSVLTGTIVLASVLSVMADPVAIPSPTDQAVEYHAVSNITWAINHLLTFLLAIVFLLLGSRTQFLTVILRFGRYRTIALVAAIFFALDWLIQLPLERYRASKLSMTKNEASAPVLQWISDQFLGSLPLVLFSVLAALGVFWLISKSPQRWWLWTSSVLSLLFLVFLAVEPLMISNKPLGWSPVEIKLSALAERIGVPRDSIALEDCEPFELCDMAHVSGLGPTRLILLNKGLFDAYPESWVLQTFTHESKHYIKDDNLTGWVVLTFIAVAFFFLLDRSCRAIILRFSGQLGIADIGQPAALPLAVLILNLMYLMALPPINTFRQHVELEADRYGLELTQETRVFAEMASSWTTRSKVHVPEPSPFFMIFRSSHPSDAARITFANEFRSDKK